MQLQVIHLKLKILNQKEKVKIFFNHIAAEYLRGLPWLTAFCVVKRASLQQPMHPPGSVCIYQILIDKMNKAK